MHADKGNWFVSLLDAVARVCEPIRAGGAASPAFSLAQHLWAATRQDTRLINAASHSFSSLFHPLCYP